MDTESPIVGEHEATALLVELEGMGRGLWLAARLARTVVTLYGEVRKIRAEHAAALAAARREGAEEMRRAAGQVCHDVYLEDPSAAVAVCIDAIRALPLDGDGGAT